MSNDLNYIAECMKKINPSTISYEAWLNVGLAVKNAGGNIDTWESWSRSDSRFREGECEKKWNSFSRDGIGVGTIVKLCRDMGITEPPVETESKVLDWNSTISKDSDADNLKIVRSEWLDTKDLPPEPADWNGVKDFTTYLKTLFQPEEYVGCVTDSWESKPDADGKTKWLPSKGLFNKTCKELLDECKKYNELGYVIGDHKPEVGAWIRFNPLDGEGVHDNNVTDYRYALVESDEISINQQYSIYKELELPIAALVTSGKKSLHAIVKINASDMKEYRNRVDYLYEVCKKNGLQIDQQNRNPSRLSRLPGVLRNGKPQRLVETNIGQASWSEWKDWIEEQNDDLPDFENLNKLMEDPPPLEEVQIEGILRCGHKMLIAGPSKAGKSFMLTQLAIATANGSKWLGKQCKQGDVLYVNLELARSSFINRSIEIHKALNIKTKTNSTIDIWHLRGRSNPMDKLAPKLIRRAMKKKYKLIIIDPIYKVITGDENSAEQMSNFCNQFDKICEQLNAATIYCHHHSKGSQGNKKSADRASGSGVFARDPDALIDLIELNMSDDLRNQIKNQWTCDAVSELMDSHGTKSWRDYVSQDDLVVSKKLVEAVQMNIKPDILNECIDEVETQASQCSAWRIEGTLREFPSLTPIHAYFRYPIHQLDEVGILKDCMASGEEESKNGKIKRAKTIRKCKTEETLNCFEILRESREEVTVRDMMESLGIGKTAMYARIKHTSGVLVQNKGIVTRPL